MKKIISSILAFLLISIPVSTTIACGEGTDGQREHTATVDKLAADAEAKRKAEAEAKALE